ncbi:FMN-binding negative transcriptional regulator [Sporosarcina sp. Te-1]|uniref:FMN-binding negative transcriptional regulator n=1 Tax=Sporosarcina sp. Te-1 TaxID=2818390 RepID=UPI001A9FE979|nr:FMN-binding negative transcriptional regulator [Sporosarcina sp. Te-1]QTD41938.1 FMN-binding negative transcriptional regulator [Sporosarcina sp. Te-1]
MYTPKYYKVTDMEEIKDFISKNSFAIFVSTRDGRSIATHLPILFQQEGEDYVVTGHMAYGNPQWKTLQESEEILLIIQGPHSYISSSWYENENVPTWNYQAVHLYGTPTILSQEDLVQDLTRLLEKYESHRPDGALWNTLSRDLLDKELRGIVGFKIKVNEVQAAFKLSQNRNDRDYETIIEKLRAEEDENSHQIAKVMAKRLDN